MEPCSGWLAVGLGQHWALQLFAMIDTCTHGPAVRFRKIYLAKSSASSAQFWTMLEDSL